MDVLLPEKLLQQVDQPQGLSSSVLEPRCSSKWSGGYISTPRVVRKTGNAYVRKSCDHVSDLSKHSNLEGSGVNVIPSLIPHPEHIHKPVKKKNRRKGKKDDKVQTNISAENGQTQCTQGISNTMVSETDIDKHRRDSNIRTTEENGHSNWQKNRKNVRDVPVHWVKKSETRYMNLQDRNVLLKPKSFSGNELLPPLSAGQGTHGGIHPNPIAESSGRVNHSFNGCFNQCESELAKDKNVKFKETFDQTLEQMIINNRNQNVSGLFRLQDRMIDSHNGFIDVYNKLQNNYNSTISERSIFNNQNVSNGFYPCSTSADLLLNLPHISGVRSGSLFSEVQSHNSMKVSVAEQLLHGTSPYGQWHPPCLDINHCFGHKITEGYTSQCISEKWISTGTMNPGLPKKLGPMGVCNDSRKVRNEVSLVKNQNLSFESIGLVDHRTTCLISGPKIPKEEKTQLGYIKLCMDIGSQYAENAMDKAYRLQIASENVLLATGSPVADFEMLVHSATPIVCLSSALQNCEVCSTNMLYSNFLCKHFKPDISLSEVWNWYEKPGNYGLEVIVQDAKSFTAYFVPLLSAVQLFSYNRGKVGSGGNDSLGLSSSPTSDNMKLVFEYFEREQPQLRKPLYDKIMELIKAGSSNNQVYGDPSMLVKMNLKDLHPASWYSVAWYPIYRIPEGRFRASFLTFHSLGHLVLRRLINSNEKQFCVASPVLGLQSYNSQGERWFSPKACPTVNSSEILNERLRILEETASLFARGRIHKDHAKVTNVQQDYEFFLARKR